MRRLAGMVVFCALLLRFMIPAGFMPVMTAQGFVVTICTGQGPLVLDLDQQGHKNPDAPMPDAKAHQPCAFAGLAPVHMAPVGTAVAVPPATFDLARPEPAYPAPSLGLAAPPPAPTGPPAFA